MQKFLFITFYASWRRQRQQRERAAIVDCRFLVFQQNILIAEAEKYENNK